MAVSREETLQEIEKITSPLREVMHQLVAERDAALAALAVYADPKNWDEHESGVNCVWIGPGIDPWDTAQNIDPSALFDPVRDIRQFHEHFGLGYDGKPRALPSGLFDFRSKFKKEELDEYAEAGDELLDRLDGAWPYKDNVEKVPELLAKQLDALVDLVYVVLGTSYLQGFDFKEAWRRVHIANMKKVRASSASDSKRGSNQDVVKPVGWQPPDHLDLLADHAHKES